ncbi:NADK2 [Cordylochernes scorpioides]|uniref:NAD(+) kinase n=1 Tax=Cordylochernes scorpioides TaxID=51811 RepID=A0ABY6LQU7_9ARAC|nr:NADK2 [Cordylochernes scorpioides]
MANDKDVELLNLLENKFKNCYTEEDEDYMKLVNKSIPVIHPWSNRNPQRRDKVKNKTPAEIQITAEQLLREAKERDLEILPPPPKQKISDPEELADYQKRKRKTFEDNIRKNRQLISNWIKYAQWEESQKQIERARSVYERALDVNHRNPTLWLKYAEMEMKNKQINHARNIWDRAVSILPRVNQFWLKYTYMEEMLGNTGGARQVFERWMDWQPYEQAWFSYIKFELRYNDVQRARSIYERFVIVHPEPSNWIRYAQFEANHGNFAEARAIYERAVEFFGDEYMDEKLLIAFAKFEESQREHDRVRAIYKYALDNYPKTQTQEILKNFTIHEKKYGDRADIEDAVINKRKAKYEEELNKNPLEYDTWFDLLRPLESEVDPDSSPDVLRQAVDNTREAYEQAIAHLPPNQEKRYWRRYNNHRFHRNDNYGRHHRNDNRNYGGGGYNDNRRYKIGSQFFKGSKNPCNIYWGKPYINQSFCKFSVRVPKNCDNDKPNLTSTESFSPKRALVLTKFSRYEFEKRRHSNLSETELIKNLKDRGSDYSMLLHHHALHTKNRDLLVDTLMKNNIETKVVNRFQYTDDLIDWADVIFTAGGDGTFLMAASKITSSDKPVIGVNSDPSRSLGYLCLPFKYTLHFPEVIARLRSGQFRWMWRQRIRVTLVGEHALDPPVELHNQQLQYPEYRFLDSWQDHFQSQSEDSRPPVRRFTLPIRALNEVFVGESLSSRVSYYELSVDSTARVKMKSSGLTVCTGTGSTSWYFNINKVTPQCVRHIFRLVNEETGGKLPIKEVSLAGKIASRFNSSLRFDASQLTLAYTIRDPVIFGTDFKSNTQGFANRIEVKSRMFDACLVIDGGLSFVFNDGALAEMEMFPEDALRTVQLDC